MGLPKSSAPPLGACYECAMTENDYRLISLRYSCPLLRKEDIQQGKVPTAPHDRFNYWRTPSPRGTQIDSSITDGRRLGSGLQRAFK